MILQALVDYYERKAGEDDAEVAPFGFARKEIPFLIVLDSEGNFVDLEDTRQSEGRKKRGREFTVPQAEKRTVAVKSNLLWDNPGYVFGIDTKGKPERARQQQDAFMEAVRDLLGRVGDDPGVHAVLTFLESEDFQPVFDHPNWPEVEASTNANLSFRLEGERQLVCQRAAVRRAIPAMTTASGAEVERCLVTGDADPVARLHPSIKGVWGAQTAGANIVSFNLGAFNSRGRSQGYNAPVGERAAFAYTTALNHLLRSDSPQRLQVGDTSTVAWAAEATPLETAFTAFFNEPPKDNPARGTEAVKALYGSPWSGQEPIREDDDTRFYVLGLAPNASRIAIRFWQESTVGELAVRFRQHFESLRITHGPRDLDILPLWRLLASTAVQGDSKNVRPNLAGAFMQSILNGTPYPRELLSAAVQRNRAEQDVSYTRAALIKACLMRFTRGSSPPLEPEITVSLDRSNPHSAYRLGRLFAVLERVQEAANLGLNATIRDRYYGAASSTPVIVFPRLLKLSNHHLAKLDNPGLRVFYEKEIGEIMSEIADFPSLLSLEDQGRFSIGYYHQRQHFFTKKDSKQGAAA
jgi:CRISPR-associated protein Csd1